MVQCSAAGGATEGRMGVTWRMAVRRQRGSKRQGCTTHGPRLTADGSRLTAHGSRYKAPPPLRERPGSELGFCSACIPPCSGATVTHGSSLGISISSSSSSGSGRGRSVTVAGARRALRSGGALLAYFWPWLRLALRV